MDLGSEYIFEGLLPNVNALLWCFFSVFPSFFSSISGFMEVKSTRYSVCFISSLSKLCFVANFYVCSFFVLFFFFFFFFATLKNFNLVEFCFLVFPASRSDTQIVLFPPPLLPLNLFVSYQRSPLLPLFF